MAITLTPPPSPGTITLTNGSDQVIGTGTAFTNYEAGYVLNPLADGAHPQILKAIADDTHATLNKPWAGADYAGAYEAWWQSNVAVYTAALRDLISLLGAGQLEQLAGLNLAASKFLGTDANKALTQYDGATLEALAGLTLAAGKIIRTDADGVPVLSSISDFALGLLTDEDAAAMLTTLGALASEFSSDLDFNGNAATNVAALNEGPLGGYRNKIINGDFDIWQRGGSIVATSGAYFADRWTSLYNGTARTAVANKAAMPPGDAEGGAGTSSYLNYVQSTAPTGEDSHWISQHIENSRVLSGKKVTLTFYARFEDAAHTIPQIQLVQEFGTGGSSPMATIVANNVAVGTSFAKFQFVATVPDITGKTVGTNDATSLYIGMPLNQTFTFDMTHVSLVEGDATAEDDPFSRRHTSQELFLCQRYYQVAGGEESSQHFGMFQAINTNTAIGPMFLPTPMRIAPSIAISSPGDFCLVNADASTLLPVTAVDLDGGKSVAYLGAHVTSGLVAGDAALFAANSLNARIMFSAEL